MSEVQRTSSVSWFSRSPVGRCLTTSALGFGFLAGAFELGDRKDDPRIQALEAQNNAAVLRLDAASDELAWRNHALSEANKGNELLASQNEELRTQNANVSAQLKHREDTLNEELAKLRNSISIQEQKGGTFTKQLNAIQSSVSTLTNGINQTAQRTGALEDSAAHIKSEVELLVQSTDIKALSEEARRSTVTLKITKIAPDPANPDEYYAQVGAGSAVYLGKDAAGRPHFITNYHNAASVKEVIGSQTINTTEGPITQNTIINLHTRRIEITFHDGTSVKGELLRLEGPYGLKLPAISPDKDLAVIRVVPEDVHKIPEDIVPAKFATKLPEQGELVVVVGNPFDVGFATSSGIVTTVIPVGINSDPENSAGAHLDFHPEEGEPFITTVVTTALVLPGNSGGIVVNKNCETIGISTATGHGLAYVVSAREVQGFLANVLPGTESNGLFVVGNFDQPKPLFAPMNLDSLKTSFGSALAHFTGNGN